MTTFYRRLRQKELAEQGDSMIGYLSLLILAWLWVPALFDVVFGW